MVSFAMDKSSINAKNAEIIKNGGIDLPAGGGGAGTAAAAAEPNIFDGTGVGLNQAQKITGGGNNQAKIQQAEQMARQWLMQQSQDAQTNQLKSQVGQNLQTNGMPLKVENIGAGAEAQTDGKSVQLNPDFVAKATVEQLAATILHEWAHPVVGGGDQMDEFKSEGFAEAFRDDRGIGEFNGDKDLMAWTDRNYSHLQKDGVNIFA